MPDEFEQALLDEIADADAVDDGELAADLRIQLNTYRAAKRQSTGDGSGPSALGGEQAPS